MCLASLKLPIKQEKKWGNTVIEARFYNAKGELINAFAVDDKKSILYPDESITWRARDKADCQKEEYASCILMIQDATAL
jgi:hypothetical protein